ncbi:MAG: polysaccharide biosynthesis protein [Lachnospiraceae bacterium]|nr:polysaccharide biosynthesis protein [Lachnospiraceae bacterium]
MLSRLIRDGKFSTLFRVLLVIADILCINISSYLALLIRFELKWSSIEAECLMAVNRMCLFNTIVTLLLFLVFRLYHSLWRYASIKEIVNILIACFIAAGIHISSLFVCYRYFTKSYVIVYLMLLIVSVIAVRFSYRLSRHLFGTYAHGGATRNTMIIGAGQAGNMVINEIVLSSKLDARIKCIIDDDPSKHNTYVHGIKVIGGRECIIEAAKNYNINEIIIAIPSAGKKTLSELIDICRQTEGQLKILPGVYQFVNGEATLEKLRNVEIEDLLGREPVKVDIESIINYVSGKVVLVTGGGGSIGSELCRQIAAHNPSKLIIVDIYENSVYDIQNELRRKFPELELVVLIASVRNTERMNSIFAKYRPNIVYHAAAHKHVPLMEDSPNEAIKNNVFGTYKTAHAASKYGVEKFVLISTDKAVNPTNIMGASKRICEMILQSFDKHSKTEFVAVRFGNVLGSNGSVIPLFRKQIENGGPVTVTHPDIIRYFMTIEEAVSLVLQAGAYAKGGEIFVLDMGEPVKIIDLAKNLIRLSGYKVGEDIEIEITGLRPGEKLYEEMLMREEGLQKTANSLIYIGKPLEFDEKELFEQLDRLYEYAYNESDDIKSVVEQIVTTYKEKETDKKRDDDILSSQFEEIGDRENFSRKLSRFF